MNPPVCTSGILLRTPRQTLRVAPPRIKLRGDAIIPEPWMGVDPPVNGIRVVVDAVAGGGGFDVTLPGGPAWTTGHKRWTYRDALGSVAGIVKAVVQDRSARQAGLVRVIVKGRNATLVLPDPAHVRTTVVVGTATECASIVWNGPGGASPRCAGSATKLVCR